MSILSHLITTEKSIGLMEFQNKLIFAVDKNATKNDIKKEVEKRFDVKVDRVTVHNVMNGEKRAFVKLNDKFRADDIAAKLKVA